MQFVILSPVLRHGAIVSIHTRVATRAQVIDCIGSLYQPALSSWLDTAGNGMVLLAGSATIVATNVPKPVTEVVRETVTTVSLCAKISV